MNEQGNKKKLGFAGRILLSANVLFALSLILAYVSPLIDPRSSSVMPLFGLLYPYLLLVNIAFVIAWLALKRVYFLLSLVTILAGWHFLSRMIQFNGREIPAEEIGPVKLASYNVQNLAGSNVGTINESIRHSILEFFGRENADIICLQEMKIPADSADEYLSGMGEQFGLTYYAMAPYRKDHGRYLYSIITFSRFPILQQRSIQKDADHYFALFTSIMHGSDTLHLYNIHLESLHFKHEDYLFLSDLEKQIGDEDKFRKGTHEIFNKLHTAYMRRAKQTNILIENAGSSFRHVIMCGDFNDTPFSYTYHLFNTYLMDAFRKSGKGFGNTYSGQLPSYRIDYIWAGNGLNVWDYRTYRVDFSDHYPISCLVSFDHDE